MQQQHQASINMDTSVKALANFNNRLFFIDLLKAMSITAVVSFHAMFVPRSSYESSALLLDILFAPLKFCVPVLLTISFLLLERGLVNKPEFNKWNLLTKRLTRLLIPAGFWFTIAALLKLITGNSLKTITLQILTGNIFTGAYYFLIIFQLFIVLILVRNSLKKARNFLLAVFCQVVIFVLIYASLSQQIFPGLIPILRQIDRPLIIYWFVYIAMGVFFYHKLPSLMQISTSFSRVWKVIILLSLSCLIISEYSLLSNLTQGKIPPFDYLIYSCIISVPVMFICFSSVVESQVSPGIRKLVYLLSKYSLGIFCINGILSQILLSFGSRWFSEFTFSFKEALIIKFFGWIFLLLISLAFSIMLEKFGFKKLVC
ncbi:acyltransferase family protein [Phormidium sp. LEGE 05292]|uniref:acyltransferase family protein n=1 Tax=[Phormidium] sp. LEGE 05292 TaxID=767427 RepID=UPI00187F4B8D|nr:acyltransferase family protein [Phormidium sp. LEGE 05292]MBE9226052.1 acyltransferase family protein [Phormidium sp. LEGE 05292]